MMKISREWYIDNVEKDDTFERFYFDFLKKKIEKKQEKNIFSKILLLDEGRKLKELLFTTPEDLRKDNFFGLLFKIAEIRLDIKAKLKALEADNTKIKLSDYSNSELIIIFEFSKHYDEKIFTRLPVLLQMKYLKNNYSIEMFNIDKVLANTKDNIKKFLEDEIEKIIKYSDIYKQEKGIETGDGIYEVMIKKYEDEVKHAIFTIRDEILNLINIKVCPYCNRNYVDTILDSQKEDKLRSTGALDHLLNENNYPFLALTLYNFVPSCTTCNSKLKLDNNDIILNPYKDEFGDECKFTVNHLTVDSLLGLDSNHRIKLRYVDSRFKNNINNFRLEDIYSNHFRDVKDMHYKNQQYTKKYIEDIENIIASGNMINYNGIKEFIYGIPKSDQFINTPLSKFKSDIYDEMMEKSNY